NTAVTNVVFGRGVAWTQKDDGLPMPVDMNDPVMALAVRSSDFLEAMNRMTVKVTGLADGRYTLRVDDEEAGAFSARQWGEGVNIAALKTPMWAQAARVHALTLKHNNLHFTRWRSLQVPMQTEKLEGVAAAMTALDSVEAELVAQQHAAAQ